MKAIAALLLFYTVKASWASWDCTEAPRLYGVRQIDAGMGQVLAVTRYGRSYQLNGRYWYSLGIYNLKHVTVGPAGTWGCDNNNKVYKLVAGNWVVVNGESLRQVDAGGDGQVVGVAPTTNYSYCQRSNYALTYYGAGSIAWTGLINRFIYISCGKLYGCWGLDAANKTYVAQSITPTTCQHSGWTHVSGPTMAMIEVSTDGKVFALGTDGKVYQRTGITSSVRAGTSWQNIPTCMPIRHLTFDLSHLWLVTTSEFILKCTKNAAP